MIKIRLDVDYAYPSRQKSFFFTALSLRVKGSYLKNSKIIAKMINESAEEVMAYWFFTPTTTPDAELLTLLRPDRHEVALHVATKPYPEWKRLEEATGRKVQYYTVHGTERLIARIVWHRKLSQAKAPIPEGFPLKSFYDFPTIHLDRIAHSNPTTKAVEIARESIAKGEILHVHPEWLFQRGKRNPRGPYYETLKTLLGVDSDLDSLLIRMRGLVKIAKFPEQFEYVKDHAASARFLDKLADRDVDLFTFVERKWCCPLTNPPSSWLREEDNVGLLKVPPYEEWLNAVGKKTRNMIRKAEKSGVTIQVVQPTEEFAEGICKIYNETPIRQGRAFRHYGWTMVDVRNVIENTPSSTFIGAYFEGELVGFVQLVKGNQVAVMTQILSMQKHWDKAINNALIAKSVETCGQNGDPWLIYGRMGNHPSLDGFKESNGFSKCTLTRYNVPLTAKGSVVCKLGLHREAKDALPIWLKNPLLPAFNWASRTKIKIKSRRR
jgi:hypothetical protein